MSTFVSSKTTYIASFHEGGLYLALHLAKKNKQTKQNKTTTTTTTKPKTKPNQTKPTDAIKASNSKPLALQSRPAPVLPP